VDQRQPSGQLRRFGIFAAMFVAVFLSGFVPMWISARAQAQSLKVLQQELRLAATQNALATAAIDARRGDYKTALEAVSRFFTSLAVEVDNADSPMAENQRTELRSLLDGRDQIVALLARSDPAAAERLSELYVTYRRVLAP
jgi:hypothetical protein